MFGDSTVWEVDIQASLAWRVHCISGMRVASRTRVYDTEEGEGRSL